MTPPAPAARPASSSPGPTAVERLAAFAERASFEDLSPDAREQLKVRVLDALGCALGALGAEPMLAVRAHSEELGGAPLCTAIGGGRSAPDRAAFHNGALVRYLDFNDSYFAPGETCHPSDNLAPVLAAASSTTRRSSSSSVCAPASGGPTTPGGGSSATGASARRRAARRPGRRCRRRRSGPPRQAPG